MITVKKVQLGFYDKPTTALYVPYGDKTHTFRIDLEELVTPKRLEKMLPYFERIIARCEKFYTSEGYCRGYSKGQKDFQKQLRELLGVN